MHMVSACTFVFEAPGVLSSALLAEGSHRAHFSLSSSKSCLNLREFSSSEKSYAETSGVLRLTPLSSRLLRQASGRQRSGETQGIRFRRFSAPGKKGPNSLGRVTISATSAFSTSFSPSSSESVVSDRLRCSMTVLDSYIVNMDAARGNYSTSFSKVAIEGRGVEGEASEGGWGWKVLRLLRELKEEGVLHGFDNAQQVPRRLYSLEELRLHRIDPTRLLSPVDATLGRVRATARVALGALFLVLWQGFGLDQLHLLGILLALLTLGAADQLVVGGAVEALLVDTLGNILSSKYQERVAHHEAGHFLVAYLLGVPPAGFTLSALDALRTSGSLTRQQAGTTFVDVEFGEQVKNGRLTSQMVDTVVCVALAGVCAEYLRYGAAEGGLSDVRQLDALFRSLSFSQKKSDEVVRWAVLNTASILRQHSDAHRCVAAAMASGASVGSCIAAVEESLQGLSSPAGGPAASATEREKRAQM